MFTPEMLESIKKVEATRAQRMGTEPRRMTAEEKAESDKFAKEYISFLNESKTEREACINAENILKENGKDAQRIRRAVIKCFGLDDNNLASMKSESQQSTK